MASIKKENAANRQWQAYLSDDDSAIAEHHIKPGGEKIRIVKEPYVPLFSLVRDGKKFGMMTPQELLYSLGDGNIEFGDYFDRAGFIEALTDSLNEYDRVKAFAHKAGKVASVVGAIAAAGIAAAVAVHVMRRKR